MHVKASYRLLPPGSHPGVSSGKPGILLAEEEVVAVRLVPTLAVPGPGDGCAPLSLAVAPDASHVAIVVLVVQSSG